MRSSKTQSIGSKTPQNALIASRLAVSNKNPAYDYSFRRTKDIEEAGGMDEYGWESVGMSNHDGEAWALPFPMKTKGHKQIKFHDTILCRRKKEISKYFRQQEDDKYNTQKLLIVEAAGRARAQLRKFDPKAEVQDNVKSSDGFSQRPGPSEEDLKEEG